MLKLTNRQLEDACLNLVENDFFPEPENYDNVEEYVEVGFRKVVEGLVDEYGEVELSEEDRKYIRDYFVEDWRLSEEEEWGELYDKLEGR